MQRESVLIGELIAELRREQESQRKQIEMLIRFVEIAINERIDMTAENAALRVVANLPRLTKRDENAD